MEFIKRNTDYALRALVYMANSIPGGAAFPSRAQGSAAGERAFSVPEIAGAEGIPEGFLHKIFQKLAKAGIVKSTRGPQGGFSLARDPEHITVLEVVEAVQGPVAVNRCLLGRDACDRWDVCKLRQSWTGIQEGFISFLRGITIKSLAMQQSDRLRRCSPRR